MAADKGKGPLAQPPATDRNTELAEMALRGAATTSQPVAEPKALPAHSGRTYDLGGTVEAVVVTPWAVIKGETLFRGDHVLAHSATVDANETLARV